VFAFQTARSFIRYPVRIRAALVLDILSRFIQRIELPEYDMPVPI
jgi:hypothetical protein